jgi:hypothetical protein
VEDLGPGLAEVERLGHEDPRLAEMQNVGKAWKATVVWPPPVPAGLGSSREDRDECKHLLFSSAGSGLRQRRRATAVLTPSPLIKVKSAGNRNSRSQKHTTSQLFSKCYFRSLSRVFGRKPAGLLQYNV